MLYLHDVMGCRLPKGCLKPTNLCMALYCIVLTQQYCKKHNNKEGSKKMRHFTKPCINLSEYWTLSMGYPAKSWKSNQTTQNKLLPKHTANTKKNRKLISPHAVCKGIRTAIKSKTDRAYKIAYLKCTLNLNSNSKNEAFSLIEAKETKAKDGI